MAFFESPLFFQRAQVCRHSVDTPCAAFFRAVFVSDVHLSRTFPEKRLNRLLEQIAACLPDAIFWGGDYAESRMLQERFFERVQERFHPPLGMFGAVGNNDLECFDMQQEPLKACIAAHGVTPLVNESVCTAMPDGGCMWVGALDDWKHGNPGGRLFEGARQEDLCVLLSHHPRTAYTHMDCCERMPDIMLCGHTHGGQFNLFGLNPYSTGLFENKDMPCRFELVSGEHRVNGVRVLVSNGIGTSLIPLRIGAPAQIHVLEFGKKE